MMSDPVSWLGWLCYAGAAVAIGVYIFHFASRQGWRRPWNAAGLFFTAIALTQAPSLFQEATSLRSPLILTACLLVATGLQAFTAMRRRKRREGDAAPGATG
jgi:predicted metal-binding membrane protein